VTLPGLSLKASLEKQKDDIASAHRAGASGFETCTALTRVVDEAIRSACDCITSDAKNNVAILAVGGYGRAELCPFSDVDVMILCDSGVWREQAGGAAKAFLHLLWDAGVDIGHSVRTVEEALAVRGGSPDSWTAMLECRFVCGNQRLAEHFFQVLKLAITDDDHRWFIESVLADLHARHGRYGNSVKLLEPNIKKSSGGLRDLQTMLWLFRGTHSEYFFPLDADTPATALFLQRLHQAGDIAADEYTDVLAALQFLFRVRHEMHYKRESLHDTLEYGLQLPVAEGLGFQPVRGASAVEAFMRLYYRHARIVNRLCARFSRTFREVVEPVEHGDGSQRVGKFFLLADDSLSVSPEIVRFESPEQILQAFVHAAENDAELDFRLQSVIERSLDSITQDRWQAVDLAVLLRRILGSKRVGYSLRTMNELDVLGRFIPEFEELVSFFQHNVYHYYTADEHTLIAISRAESLREETGVLHEVFRNLKRKDVLYLAILLHDIAKPVGVAEHEIVGVAIAERILRRLDMEDVVPMVTFLIRHHLVMEQVAFRRDIHDPQTIKEFASRFERPEQLDYLFLLTYADLSAVNINVWTEWKASMLRDLYLSTSEILRRNLTGAQVDEFHQFKREAAVSEAVGRLSKLIPREQVENHLLGIQSESYVSLFSDQEIARHIERAVTPEPITALFRQLEGYTDVTIIGRDAPFVLSRCCAVLSANDANIFDANIFTRDDGVIIDRFRVSDTTTRRHLEKPVCEKISEDLQQVMEGTLDIDHLLEAHKRKWKRKPRIPVNPNVRTDVEFEDNPRFTIIDVYALDSVGFLYRVTETMSNLGLDIHFAKIATRGDGVVDAFYVLDNKGQPITDPAQRDRIRNELLETIRRLSEEQLA
jgi:[protein-PII] uridylyltransferase